MSYATKDAFFKGFQRRWLYDVPSPLGDVVVGSVSEREHQAFERKLKKLEKAKTAESVRLWYMGLGLWKPNLDEAGNWKLDGSGKRIPPTEKYFTDDEIQQIVDSDIDYAVTRQLTDKIIEHLGVAEADLEELAKN